MSLVVALTINRMKGEKHPNTQIAPSKSRFSFNLKNFGNTARVPNTRNTTQRGNKNINGIPHMNHRNAILIPPFSSASGLTY
jgi:hypothetical protein